VYTNDGLIVTRNSQRLSVLSIESVRARHAGNYSCVATNNAGAITQSAMLAVNGYSPAFKKPEVLSFPCLLLLFALPSTLIQSCPK